MALLSASIPGSMHKQIMYLLQTCDMQSWVVALLYLLTHAGATQVSDYLAAVCDYNSAGSVMMKQLTDFIQQSFTHQDVLESNHGNMINIGIQTE